MDLLNASQSKFNELFTSLDGGLLPNVKDLSHIPVSKPRQDMYDQKVKSNQHMLDILAGKLPK